MKKILLILLFIAFINKCYAINDSLNFEKLKSKIEILQNKVDEIKRDQLNYSIEKDLLKNTYSNNYDKINLFITGILLIFGFLGFLGLRDINSIKKEYNEELSKIRGLQNEIVSKSNEFNETKIKYDIEIKEILKQNEEQNRKLKVLEIKDQIERLSKEKKYEKVIEYCIIALEFAPNDIDLLRSKAQAYSRITNYSEAIEVYKRILEIDANNSSSILDLSELLLFEKKEDLCTELIKKYQDIFKSKSNGQLLILFDLLIHFNKSEISELKEKILNLIERTDLENRKKRMVGWNLYDSILYVSKQPESEEKKFMRNFLFYLDGQLSAKETLERLGEKVLEKEENKVKKK
jgi:tetratricopeptide (TPR) repeat protein